MKAEEILIEVEPERREELLGILGKINFIKVLTKESVLKDFVNASHTNVPLSEQEIDDLVFEERYALRKH